MGKKYASERILGSGARSAALLRRRNVARSKADSTSSKEAASL
jgi:hypothetical protein